jgi:hypothetical protein
MEQSAIDLWEAVLRQPRIERDQPTPRIRPSRTRSEAAIPFYADAVAQFLAAKAP